MKRLCALLIFSCVSAGFAAELSGNTDIDWQAAIIRFYNRHEFEYGVPNGTSTLVKHNYPEGFVWLSPNSIVLGKFEELKQHLEKRQKVAHWERGLPNIVLTCGNTALAWNLLVLTDDKTLRREGLETMLYENVDGMAKLKLVQFPV